MRQQSVRVAEYTQILFKNACKSSSYATDHETPVYMDEAYEEVAYKCGFYHQIGKSLDPEKYQGWDEKISEEEKQEYCTYTTEGRKLVARLQGEEREEDLTIPGRMIQEACEQHMEHWDGSGYPNGYAHNDISLIAQIVGLAKELDRLVCERKSENPFEEALELLLKEEEKKFSANLMKVFRTSQAELRTVYKKYIQYTRTMPGTVPLVEKRPERPFGLKYRQIVSGMDKPELVFEAVPWYAKVLEEQSPAEIERLLMRTGMIHEIMIYFLYEAADGIARMTNCQLSNGGVLVPVFGAFYQGENQSEKLRQLYEDTSIDPKTLMLTVQEALLKADPAVEKRLTEYIDRGVVLVLDNFHPEELPLEKIRQIGFTHVRIAKDSVCFENSRQLQSNLYQHGITVIDWPAGEGQLTEDELIHYLMTYE